MASTPSLQRPSESKAWLAATALPEQPADLAWVCPAMYSVRGASQRVNLSVAVGDSSGPQACRLAASTATVLLCHGYTPPSHTQSNKTAHASDMIPSAKPKHCQVGSLCCTACLITFMQHSGTEGTVL